jgi:hydrogenase maturation factor
MKKIPKKHHERIFEHLSVIGVPTHTDHVLSIFLRTGHHAIVHTVKTMDECRISWGKVISISGNNHYIVRVRPLQTEGARIILGSPIDRVIVGVLPEIPVGAWVSIHWGFICDVLSEKERDNLMRFTSRSLAVHTISV